ncbi:MAG: hypothetical protein HY291_21965, partial [Planctomycetes bacterium]|nr:hypothetical protein [Planctomycetota bacterium]
MGKFVPILVMALVISAKLFCAERDPLEEDRTRADALSEKSGAALVEAVLREVNQGNIWAARKMIEWAMWDHMGQVDFKRLSRWKEDSTTEVGDLKPIQIFAALEANWADRQWSLSRVNREKVILSARDRLEKEPLKNATLKSTLSWLYLSFPPKDLKKSNALAQDACVGL